MMKVECNPQDRRVKVGSLDSGDTFTLDGDLYILSDYRDADGDRIPIRLSDGWSNCINSQEIVIPVKLKVVLDTD